MQKKFAVIGWTIMLVLSLAVPSQADSRWSKCQGSYSLVPAMPGARGLLMLKPLDDGCVLFDLSVTAPLASVKDAAAKKGDADNVDIKRPAAIERDNKNSAVVEPSTEPEDAESVSYRVSGIFLLDEEGRGYWENESGQALTFAPYRQRVLVRGAGKIPSELCGNFEIFSRAVNGTAPMIEKFIYYLPQFKTGLSHSEHYQVTDISSITSDFRQLRFVGDQGKQQDFWVRPDLSQVLRVEGLDGIVLYQDPQAETKQ